MLNEGSFYYGSNCYCGTVCHVHVFIVSGIVEVACFILWGNDDLRLSSECEWIFVGVSKFQ